jgi:hypothetical protein
VHVLAAPEDLLQHRLVGDVREQAQLDLRVVGEISMWPSSATKQARISRPCSVRIGMFWRFGSVLDSRPVAVAGLVEGRVEAAVVADQLGEGVQVGRLQLRDLAPLLDRGDDLVLAADRLQHARVGGEARLAAALARQPQVLEEDVAELWGEPIVNSSPAKIPDAPLELGGPPVRSAPRCPGAAPRRA